MMRRLIKSFPIVGPVVNHVCKIPRVRWSIDEIRLRRKYGRHFPEYVVLPNSQAPIYLDSREQRGRLLLLGQAKGQSLLKNIWHQAITQIKPDIVIDVGANYGEFVFGERYPDSQRVIAIEANAKLAPWLKRSLQEHPDSEKIRVEIALAAEKTGEARSFFVNAYSSGRSSAISRETDTWSEQESSTVALDDMAEGIDLPSARVVFKIDVEGYESQVLSGMTHLVSEPQTIFGIIEFNSCFIRQAGKNPAEFLRFLSDHFSVVALPKAGKYVLLEEVSMQRLRELTASPDEVELDLVLMSEKELVTIVDRSLKS